MNKEVRFYPSLCPVAVSMYEIVSSHGIYMYIRAVSIRAAGVRSGPMVKG